MMCRGSCAEVLRSDVFYQVTKTYASFPEDLPPGPGYVVLAVDLLY
jgi:hypothetical protein